MSEAWSTAGYAESRIPTRGPIRRSIVAVKIAPTPLLPYTMGQESRRGACPLLRRWRGNEPLPIAGKKAVAKRFEMNRLIWLSSDILYHFIS